MGTLGRALRFARMDEREQKKKRVREIVTQKLRRFFAELKEKCADAEEFFHKALQRRKPPDQPR